MSGGPSAGAQAGPLIFWTADPEAPSFRHRLAPLLPLLAERGWRPELRILPAQRYGWRIWQARQALRGSAAVVLHKLRLEPWELRWLQRLQPRMLYDLDDAIWLRQPKFDGQLRPASPRRARNVAATCAAAQLTTVGNAVLAAHVQGCGGRVQIVPTSVAAAGYAPRTEASTGPGATLVWVGLPHNLAHLAPLRGVLARLAGRHPGLTLRVISSAWPDWAELPIERVAWSAQGEAAAIASADIGLMPLSDDEFARGKCAFKLLQYMAAGLPCVASPVGANQEVVRAGQSGWLARSPEEWEGALERLILDPALRQAMGAAGRQRVLADFDRPQVMARMAGLVEALACGAYDAAPLPAAALR